MNEDQLTAALALDKIHQCEEKNYLTSTTFLDTHQQSVVRRAAAGSRCRLEYYGGYEDAERRILVCLPDYLELADADVLTVIRAQIANPGGRKLAHKDYLGSLMGLGIRREMIGDILVREDGADIIALTEIAPYLLNEYRKAGKTELTLEEKPVSELILPQVQTRTVRDTVASMRLDGIVAAGFGLSRGKAAEAIRAGQVMLNHIETVKPDAAVQEGDLINLRRSGRIRITETGGRSRKGRIVIEMEVYR